MKIYTRRCSSFVCHFNGIKTNKKRDEVFYTFVMKLKQRTHTHRDDISVTRHNKSILFHLSLFFISVSSTLSLSYSRQSSRSAHGRQATEFNGEGVLAEVAFVYMLQMWGEFRRRKKMRFCNCSGRATKSSQLLFVSALSFKQP